MEISKEQELEDLRIQQSDHSNWLSEESFNQLNKLAEELNGNPGNPHKPKNAAIAEINTEVSEEMEQHISLIEHLNNKFREYFNKILMLPKKYFK